MKSLIIALLLALSFSLVPAQTKAQGHFITLTWNAPVGGTAVTSYNVYRSTVSGSGYVKIANCLSTSLTDNTPVIGTKYFYVVRAVDAGGDEAPNSNEASALIPIPIPPPLPCTNLVAVAH